jgi:methylmalonyl-CoA/ethylmalonyl-CoA epimerase
VSDPFHEEAARMDVTRIDQVGIAVEDLDAALDLYARAFGILPISREHVEHDGVEEAMLEVGGVHLQLVQSTREGSPIERFIERRGPGMHHLGLAVRSLDDALDHLRSEGLELIDEVPRRGGGGHLVAFVHPRSTGGILVELIEDPAADDDAADGPA